MNIRQVLRPNLQQQVTANERRPQKKGAAALTGRGTDRLSWSKQALAYIDEQNRRVWEKSADREENEDPQLKALKKEMKRQDKCLRIAARVRKGDKVPPEDLDYLQTFDRAGYVLALASRKPNPHPKKWESELDEEDLQDLETSKTAALSAIAPVSVPEHGTDE